MPSGKHTWSQTAATNASADSNISWPEGQAPGSVNDSARAEMAVEAKWLADNSGSLTTGGSSTAFTLATNTVFTTLALLSGQKLCVKFNATNGAAATLNVDTLGAKALQVVSGVAIPTGMITANSIFDVTYDNSIPAFIVHGLPAASTGLAFSGAATPLTNDGAALGTTALEWSDLFLASGSVINWANGDAVLTHSADTLTLAGANVSFGNTVSAGNFTISGNSVLTTASVADQAAEEAASSITLYTSPGRQQHHPSAAKAWAFVTLSGGSPSLTAFYNCTSISDDNVGLWTVTLTTAFSSANYSVVVSMEGAIDPSFLSYVEVRAKTASTIQFALRTASGGANTIPAALDRSFHFVAYGDQ